MKKNIFIALIIIFFASGFIVFQTWKTTPKYSLLKVIDAVEKKDSYAFEKYVDTERVISDILDIYIRLSAEIAYADEYEYSLFDASLYEGIAETFKPVLATAIKNQIIDFIENEDAAHENEAVESFNYIFSNFELVSITRNDLTAEVIFSFDSIDDLPRIIVFEQRKFENYWRITRIKNIEDFLEDFSEDLINDLLDSFDSEWEW